MAAQHLRVRVINAGKVKVDLTFPARAAATLPDLVSGDLAGRLAERGIDPAKLAVDAVASGFAPRDLFDMNEGEKQVRVWLE
jgi:hypothetical protein